MSLLEDLVHVMRCVLEYFGVPQDMLVPVWESTLCGQYRSIVRMIGTNLPLTLYPRLHFQVPLQTIRRHGHIEVSVDAPAIPSLADVLWLAEDEGDSCTKFRNCVPLRKQGRSYGIETPASVCVRPVREQKLHAAQASSTQPEAFVKIQALEAELQKLRAQIAMIVTTPSDGSLLNNPSTPCSRFPAPVLTSTPFLAALPPPPPPPPLPPPPPPPLGAFSKQVSVTDVIKQRKAARKDKAGVCEASSAAVPSMLEVLKDLNQVKLRTVERSPGGTPARKRRSRGNVCASDPAALIAEALKRKFAHRHRDNSFDKENRSAEPSPFSSPDTPRIPLYKRRSQGQKHSSPLIHGADRKQCDGK
ncbi:mitochondrial fission regulator 2 isoform X2 [Tachysurus vachellii]|uniref:mitochondrial fission regulator 2 isoform X2 n=1 Tax=Tachysurus vachellii TaxID=175792 RepID=UPI00296AF5E2|nr:mitochondrial fission regulator 2 isoform X2 [Tachysurus vachellii]